MTTQTVNLVSIATHRYDKRQLIPGDTFTATPRDALILVGLGRAILEEEPKTENVEVYTTRDLKAENAFAPKADKPKGKRGPYRRRDLRAKD